MNDTETPRPVPDAYDTGDGLLMAWCEHERRWHTHGRCGPYKNDSTCLHARRPVAGTKCTCPPGNGDGHRVAHCSCPRSPYQARGYVLREVGPYTAAVRGQHKETRATAECPGAECVAHRAEQAERKWRYTYGFDTLAIDCPECGAKVGDECRISRGHVHTAARLMHRWSELVASIVR